MKLLIPVMYTMKHILFGAISAKFNTFQPKVNLKQAEVTSQPHNHQHCSVFKLIFVTYSQAIGLTKKVLQGNQIVDRFKIKTIDCSVM